MKLIKKKETNKILGIVEKLGNTLPHPAIIFVIFIVIIAIASDICAKLNVTVHYNVLDRATNEIQNVSTVAISLLAPNGLRYMFTSVVQNFTGFAPLGTVLIALLGVGVAEGTGLIGACLTKLIHSTPKRLVTLVVVFAGVLSSIASDAGYVILIPLGAVVFMRLGRHPLAGIAAAFAGVSGGFSANLMVGPTDAILSGITTESTNLSSVPMVVGIADNWYFIIASTFLITMIGTLVTEKIVEPHLGVYRGEATEQLEDITLTSNQARGLNFASISLLLTVFIFAYLLFPIDLPIGAWNGVLSNPTTGEILNSPFMNSIVIIISLLFFIPGVAYGVGSQTIDDSSKVIDLMSSSMATMGGYIILVFFAAQFIAYFTYTNLGIIIAVNGANLLKKIGLTGIPLILAFIIVVAIINIFMGSASAKWAIMAPIFVPLLIQMNLSPALTQMAYRIGDSTTNLISPLMSYFALIIAFSQKYDKNAGAGTIISTMLPYSIAFLLGWAVLLIIWFYTNLPLGPHVPIRM